MNCRSIPERDDWFLTDRKPTICPRCGKKEVRKAVLGYPSPEDFNNKNIYLIGCIPDYPSIELGVVEIVVLDFGKILQEIKPH